MTGIPKWTYTNWGRPSDPINIVFSYITLVDVEDFLRNNGWNDADLSWDQFIPSPSSINKRRQDLDLAKNVRWIFQRYHIRLWDLEPDSIIIGSVHLDYTRSKGHESADFESIEKDFSDICEQNHNWIVKRNDMYFDNRFAGYGEPYNDGRATVITPR